MTKGTTLADELAADQGKSGSACQTCAWLSGRPRAEAAQFDEAMRNGWTTESIHRAMRRRGATMGVSAVRTHRRKRHA